jgi:predicted peroxiredoxin
MTKILFVGTHGTEDPTRATFPFMEAKGAVEAGYETGIILMMEAAPLIKDQVAAQVRGVGVPPLVELMDSLASHGVRISVCEPSGRALGVCPRTSATPTAGPAGRVLDRMVSQEHAGAAETADRALHFNTIS